MTHHNRYGLRRLLSLLLGLVFAALGVGATLGILGLSLGIPAIVFHPQVLKISIVVAALLLFLDSFSVSMEGKFQIGSTIVALVLAAIGAVPLLMDYNVLHTILPFVPEVSIPPIVFSIMLALYGLYLIVVYTKLKRASLFFY